MYVYDASKYCIYIYYAHKDVRSTTLINTVFQLKKPRLTFGLVASASYHIRVCLYVLPQGFLRSFISQLIREFFVNTAQVLMNDG